MGLMDHKKPLLQGGALLSATGLLGVSLAWSPVDVGVTASEPTQAAPSAGTDSTSAQPEQVAEEDQVSGNHYAQVQRLRRSAALTHQDLAALGLTPELTEAVLGRLLEWVRTNEAAFVASRRTVMDARRALAEAERAQRVGAEDGGEPADLTRAREALVTAEQAHLAGCDQGALYALSVAPDSVQERWRDAAVYRGCGLPLEVRYVSSLTEQRADELAEQMSASSDLPVQALTSYEKSRVAEVRARIGTHLSGVVAAEEAVLPLPAELREDEAGMLFGEEHVAAEDR